MKKPIIAISASCDTNQRISASNDYLNSIYEAGGIPVFVPRTVDPARLDMYAADFDGFLFSGGVDLNPVTYGEEVSADNVEIDDSRDAFELELFKRVITLGKPILGICRGIQLINVALGGTLYQDIKGHRQQELGYQGLDRPQHVSVKAGSMLEEIGGQLSIMTNSYHHQNIKGLAPTLVVDAVSDDGYIEAVHSVEQKFLFGVQWHPEVFRMFDPVAASIFKAFIAAAK